MSHITDSECGYDESFITTHFFEQRENNLTIDVWLHPEAFIPTLNFNHFFVFNLLHCCFASTWRLIYRTVEAMSKRWYVSGSSIRISRNIVVRDINDMKTGCVPDYKFARNIKHTLVMSSIQRVVHNGCNLVLYKSNGSWVTPTAFLGAAVEGARGFVFLCFYCACVFCARVQ